MLTPKDFLLQTNSLYLKPGVYTVLPLYKKGIFDIPFHINRLYDSYNLLQDNEHELMNYKDFKEYVMKSIINSKNSCKTSDYGIYTISMGKKTDTDNIEILTMYSDKSTAINNDQLQYYIDFAECKRFPVQAKYISWIYERSIFEKNRLSFIKETILYQQNIITNEKSSSISNCKSITEGFTSNFFIIDKDNRVLTCQDNMILPGSISKLIKTICKYHNIPIIETIIDLNDIHNWRGMFITNSVKNIQCIDGFYINNDLIINNPASLQYTILDKFNEYDIYKFNADSKRNSDRIINLIKDTLYSYLFTDNHTEIDAFIEKIYQYSPWYKQS